MAIAGVTQGPFAMSYQVPLTLQDPQAQHGMASTSIQIQNTTGFVLVVTCAGNQWTIQQNMAQTIPTQDGYPVQIQPTQNQFTTANQLNVVWTTDGQLNPTPDGVLIASASGNVSTYYVYVACAGGTVVIINPLTYLVVGTVGVGLSPAGVACNPAFTYLAVCNSGGTTVSIVNLSTSLVAYTVTVGNGPQSCVFTPDGTKLLVTNKTDGTVSVINTATWTVAATPAGMTGAYGVTVNSAGTVAYISTSSYIFSVTIPGYVVTQYSGQPSTSWLGIATTSSGIIAVDTTRGVAEMMPPVGYELVGTSSGNSGKSVVYYNGFYWFMLASTIQVISATTFQLVTTVTAGSYNTAMVLNTVQSPPVLYVVNATTTIYVVNTSTYGVTTLTAPYGASDICNAPGSTYAWAIIGSGYNTESFPITQATNVMGTVLVHGSATTSYVSMSPNGAYVAVSMTGYTTAYIISTGSLSVVASPVLSVAPVGPATFTSTSSIAYFPCTTVVNTVTLPGYVVANFTLATTSLGQANGIIWSVNNTTTVNLVTQGTTTLLSTATAPASIVAVNVLSNGNVALQVSGGNVYIYTGTSPAALNAATVVGTTPNGVAVSPSGTYAYVCNTGGGTVSVINLTNNAIVSTITVGTNPTNIAVSPDGKTGFVTNNGAATISILNLQINQVAASVTVANNPTGVAVS